MANSWYPKGSVQLKTTVNEYTGDVHIIDQNPRSNDRADFTKQPNGTYDIYVSSGEFAQRVTGMHGLQSLVELPGKILKERR